MNYVDIFWHTFKDDFKESEEERSERQQKERLLAILGEVPEKSVEDWLVIEGELYSH